MALLISTLHNYSVTVQFGRVRGHAALVHGHNTKSKPFKFGRRHSHRATNMSKGLNTLSLVEVWPTCVANVDRVHAQKSLN